VRDERRARSSGFQNGCRPEGVVESVTVRGGIPLNWLGVEGQGNNARRATAIGRRTADHWARLRSAQDCPGAAEMGLVEPCEGTFWRWVERCTETGVDLSCRRVSGRMQVSPPGPTSVGERGSDRDHQTTGFTRFSGDLSSL
jgi:hypothetical protein